MPELVPRKTKNMIEVTVDPKHQIQSCRNTVNGIYKLFMTGQFSNSKHRLLFKQFKEIKLIILMTLSC